MPARLKPPLAVIVRPFQRFARIQTSEGLVLLFCTAVALLWANSPWNESYSSLWETEIALHVGDWVLSYTLLHWINDGLMAVFFFVVGLEIKREVLAGELASPRKAVLPLAAALGGMILPALLFTAFNYNGEAARGWGIPMATDIAFALGALALAGRRVPNGLKVFLVALAIVDDIGAVLVIAIFYAGDVALNALAAAAVVTAVLVFFNRSGVRHTLVYAFLGVALWLAFLLSGVHATVAGVVLAMTVPARSSIGTDRFASNVRDLLARFEQAGRPSRGLLGDERRQSVALEIEAEATHVGVPLNRLEHVLQPWVAYAIMPVFALANAGVALHGNLWEQLTSPLSLGIVVGLVVGKQLGILSFAYGATRFRLADKPRGATWLQVYGTCWLGGIGFTMALFIAGLAFDGSPLLETAKTAILLASAVSGVVGWIILRAAPLHTPRGE